MITAFSLYLLLINWYNLEFNIYNMIVYILALLDSMLADLLVLIMIVNIF